ncbi:Ig-like domain repeat protein [Ruminococcus bicirculans (ex Wegman et al. 2014)]|uniref:Ig-like domain repeat protein n=1 Tax=Ruminococcus bicirculans (ex Wegman et al. 2014) TaxID=1160721 RepID=UPI00307BAA1B
MKINNLMKRLSATIVAIALTFSSLVLPLDAIAAVSSSTAATEDTNTDNSGEGGVIGDSDKSGDNSGEETPDEGFDIKDFHNSSEGNWTNGKVSVSFSVTKNIEKVDYAYFDEDIEANRKTSEDGKFSFDFDNEQDKEHTFYVVDKEGNVTEVGKTNVKIDRSEPTTDNFYCNYDGKWVNKDNSDNVIVSFTAKDELSGVAYAYVDEDTASNRKNVQTGTDKFTFEFKKDQNTKHKFYVVDNVGHTKEVGEVDVKIDKTAPKITLTNSSDGKWLNVSDKADKVTVTLNITENGSGIKELYYESTDGKIKGVGKIADTSRVWNVSFDKDQNQEYKFYVVDNAGNKSDVKTTVQKDKKAPEIKEATYTNISYKDGVSIAKQLKLPMPSISGMVLARNYIVLEVDVFDEMSGIDEKNLDSFVLKNGKETIKTLAVEKSGDKFAVIANAENLNAKEGIISDVQVYAKDRAGNLSDAYKDKITFDTRKPKCEIDGFTLNDKCDEYKISGFKPTTERKVYAIVTSDASLKNSSDELAAAVKEAVEKNEKPIIVNGASADMVTLAEDNKYDFTFPAGNASFYVNVIDEVGNVSEFEFKADKTPIGDSDIKLKATHKVDNKETDYTQSSWTNSDVTVEVSVPDEKVTWNGNTATAVTKLSKVYWSKTNKFDSTAEEIKSYESGKFKQTFEKSGKYYFYAVDESGNVSEGQEFVINIDKAGPEIKEFTNDYDEKWTNGNVDVSFEANDDVSGIAKVYVDIDDERHQIQAVNGKYNYTFTDEQDKEHTFYVVDNAGNVSKKTTKIQIDRAKPVITEFKVSPDKEWANKKDEAVTVSFKANDNKGKYVSGIASAYIVINGKEDEIKPNEQGVYSYKFTAEQNTKPEFYVIDNAGNKSKVQTTEIKIDKTKPVIEKKSVEIVDEAGNSVSMTRLKWCIIHNKDIKIRVQANMVADSASGVYSVKLITSKENSYEIKTKDLNGDYYEFTVQSELLALEVLHENVRFVVTDNAANESEEYKLKDLTKNPSNSDDILIDKTKPNIKEITLIEAHYTDSDGRRWYNTPNIKASAYFEDTAKKGKTASGLESIQISALNSKTAESDKDWGIKNRTYSVTSNSSDLNANGTIDFEATAKDLAGNEADKKRATVYVDTFAPVINKISVNGVVVSNNGGKYAVEAFGNSARRVEISASDISGNKSGISGLNSITYSLYDENGKEIRKETVSVSGNNASISFDISPNFKGHIKAFATDNVKNEGAKTKSRFVVVENSSKHNETSSINIKLPQTSKKDSSGNNLYNNDIDVQFSVSDSYSGVKSVSYTIKDRNGENTVTVGDMSVDKSDGNINTELSKTIKVGNNENDIKLTVTIEDNAGNKSSKDVTFSIDKTAPTIEVTFDNNNRNRNYSDSEYYKADRTATVTITERNFNEADVKATIAGLSSGNPTISSFTTVAGSTPDQTKHVAKITFGKDADYTMSIDFTDMAGNRASQYKSNKFTIDKTKPVISEIKLSPSPSNSKYFNEDVTVSVTVNEHNFDSSLVKFTSIKGTLPKIPKSDWKDDGDKHTVSFKLKAEDIYSFRVGMTDKAVNSAADKTQSEIVLDKTKPSVEISGVKDKKAYGYNDKDKVAPVFTFSDTNIDPENVSYKIYKIGQDGSKTDVTSKFDNTKSNVKNGAMTVSFNEFKSTSDVDGLYTIEVSSKDLAGNESSDTKVFSVNRYGSSFVIDDSMKDLIHSYISKGEDVKVKIINVNKISDENTTVTVTYNGTNITLKAGTDYTFSTISESDDGWCEYEVTINKSVFEKDGSYSVKVTAVDEANNTSTNTDDAHVSSDEAPKIDFYVDTTKPEVTITGAEKDAVYKEVTKQITVTVEDANIDADNLADVLDIQVNGEAVTNYEAEDDAGTVTAKFIVKGDKITIKASAVDKAGNKSDVEELSFRLNANWLLRLYSNKPLFYSILAAILLAVAGVIIIIIRKKK